MYFSAKAQGFYVGDELDKEVMPDDCIEVSDEQEEDIRVEIMKGNIVSIKSGDVVATPRD
ncbi:hypothetical protein [Enterobacter roggenkampii]|uniref:hypothetical protein n=1 Tax=Enterobacter roggenkampii TaxID=1812935 RepID=UPI001BE01940|nr:hypothetical protein [Enterobacter roggenkampii]WCF40395.1 hypothetical protein KK030_23805 [Enterobacter roggenkampii]